MERKGLNLKKSISKIPPQYTYIQCTYHSWPLQKLKALAALGNVQFSGPPKRAALNFPFISAFPLSAASITKQLVSYSVRGNYTKFVEVSLTKLLTALYRHACFLISNNYCYDL